MPDGEERPVVYASQTDKEALAIPPIPVWPFYTCDQSPATDCPVFVVVVERNIFATAASRL